MNYLTSWYFNLFRTKWVSYAYLAILPLLFVGLVFSCTGADGEVCEGYRAYLNLSGGGIVVWFIVLFGIYQSKEKKEES